GFFFQAEDGIRDPLVTGVQTCALPIWAGGQIAVVTSSGTNTWHGSGFEYLRNSALDARNFFDQTTSTPPFKRNQFGGTLGGPIRSEERRVGKGCRARWVSEIRKSRWNR